MAFVVTAGVLATAYSCSPSKPSDIPISGDVRKAADEARSQGKNQATMQLFIRDVGTDHSFDRAIDEFSVVVVRPLRLSAATTTLNSIRTWHVFRVIETVSRRSPSPDDCEAYVPPSSVPVNTDEVAIELFAGSVDVAGVKVTMDTLHSLVKFEPDQTYVLIGALCQARTLQLAFGPYGVYQISPNGFIPGAVADPAVSRPFLEEMLNLKTLDNLKKRLQTPQRDSEDRE